MQVITSKENKIYKKCLLLASEKRQRDKAGEYVIEGENLLAEAEICGVSPVFTVFCEGTKAARQAAEEGFFGEGYIFSAPLFKSVSDTVTPQGVFAVVKKPELSAEEFLKRAGKANVLILDRLQDPGNIGTLIRTAAAAGYGGIVALKGTGDIFSPKVVRAAAGSVFRLPIFFADEPREVLALMKKSGRRTVATVPAAGKNYYEEDLKDGVALIIGNEGNGISADLAEGADTRVKIPMAASVESLNAGIAAAILMYEAVRP